MRAVLAAVGDLTPPEVPAEEARRAADEVLADPVFDRPGPGLLSRARDWFLERLQDAFDAVAGSGGSVLGWVVVAVLVVAAVVLAVRFTRGVQRDPRAVGASDEPRRPAADWSAEAARLEAQGDWRGALRCRHRGLVAALAARGLVDEVAGRTAGEYRAEVGRSLPSVSPAFDSATALFEVAWYGGRQVGPEDADRFGDLSQRVLAGAGVRR